MSTKRVGKITYDMNKILGRGSFAFVFLGSLQLNHNNESNINNDRLLEVAVKRLQFSQQEEKAILREIQLMQKVSDHPNILRYIYTEKDDFFVFIAMELCSGTLEDYVAGKYQGPRFSGEKEILCQGTQGLAHLHSKGIVHRDIKPTNILICVRDKGSETEKPQIKLADFGISKVLSADRNDCTNTSVTNPNGTKGWMAPEVYEVNRFDCKVDIFPLGCIFAYTLSGGKHPFGDDSITRIYQMRRKGVMILAQDDLKKPYSEEGFKLIKAMLQMNPANRPTAEDVLKSPFFVVVNCPNNTKDVERDSFHVPGPTQLIQSINLTKEFMDFCISLNKSITDDAVSRLKGLIKDERVDVNALERNHGMNPLSLLIYYLPNHRDLLELASLLIQKGANINGTTSLNYNYRQCSAPLHRLCENDRLSDQSIIDLIQLLLQHGADVNIKDDLGRSPLHTFCIHFRNKKFIDILQLLIQNGARVNTIDAQNETPLHALCRNYKEDNLIDVLRLLIQNGADVNAKGKYGMWTPLFVLCVFQKENEKMSDVIRLLIQNGADVIVNSNGYTPLYVLCDSYRKDKHLIGMVKLLVQNGADINAVASFSGMTPLHILRRRGFHV